MAIDGLDARHIATGIDHHAALGLLVPYQRAVLLNGVTGTMPALSRMSAADFELLMLLPYETTRQPRSNHMH